MSVSGRDDDEDMAGYLNFDNATEKEKKKKHKNKILTFEGGKKREKKK